MRFTIPVKWGVQISETMLIIKKIKKYEGWWIWRKTLTSWIHHDGWLVGRVGKKKTPNNFYKITWWQDFVAGVQLLTQK